MKRFICRLILAHKFRKFHRWQEKRKRANREAYREVFRRVEQIRLP